MSFFLRKPSLLLFLSTVVFFDCATTTSPVLVGSDDDTAFYQLADRGEMIFVLPPQMTFEDAATEAPLSSQMNGGDEVYYAMMSLVSEGLQAEGFMVLTQDSIGTDAQSAAGNIIQNLEEESRVLTSSTKDKSALLPLLNQLAEITGTNVACVQTVKAKIGIGAMYDMNSGAMAQGTSTSAIKVVLVSLTDGSIIWKNESFVRDKPTSSKFNQAVKMLFATPKPRRN
jgi:hypothetical protein